MATNPGKLLTYSDYAAFPDDGIRREIIHGKVVVTPAPNVRHQQIALRLASLFLAHADRSGRGLALIAPTDVLLSEHDIVQPDVLFITDDRAGIVTEPNIVGAPSLAVEVLSDPRTDRVRKRELYARSGIPEYWIVDPKTDQIEVYTLAGDEYGEARVFRAGDTITPATISDLTVDVAAILKR